MTNEWQSLPRRQPKRPRRFGARGHRDDKNEAKKEEEEEEDREEEEEATGQATRQAEGKLPALTESAAAAVVNDDEAPTPSSCQARAPATEYTAPPPLPSGSAVLAVADASASPPQFEYLDHTADVQLHAWSPASLAGAFAQCALAMYGYMTDLDKVELSARDDTDDDEHCRHGRGSRDSGKASSRLCTVELEARGHDAKSLLYNFLDECLYNFSTEYFVMRRVEVLQFDDGRVVVAAAADDDATAAVDAHATGDAGAAEAWRIRVRGYGERFSLAKHAQGTEVKAITYSAMALMRDGVTYESLGEADARAAEEAERRQRRHGSSRDHDDDSGYEARRAHRYDVYVIVDI